MKKFYYIYEIKEDWGEKFVYKAFSEHSAIEWIKELETYKEKGWSVFRGGFCDDGSETERLLCDSALEIDKEDIYFKNDSGY